MTLRVTSNSPQLCTADPGRGKADCAGGWTQREGSVQSKPTWLDVSRSRCLFAAQGPGLFQHWLHGAPEGGVCFLCKEVSSNVFWNIL